MKAMEILRIKPQNSKDVSIKFFWIVLPYFVGYLATYFFTNGYMKSVLDINKDIGFLEIYFWGLYNLLGIVGTYHLLNVIVSKRKVLYKPLFVFTILYYSFLVSICIAIKTDDEKFATFKGLDFNFSIEHLRGKDKFPDIVTNQSKNI